MANNETILVTGGCGFIGCNFVRMMINKHPEVEIVNFDALTYAGNLDNLTDVMDSSQYHFVRGDIQDAALVSKVIADYEISGIINFAAESHVDRSITGPKVFIDTNVSGTLNLLQQANEHGIKRYLQVSTDEVYGSLGATGAFTEESPLCPNSPYSASKTAADHFVRAYHHTFGLDTIVTRCSNNYGPYQFPEKLIPLMFNNARIDKPLPVYGDGANVRDWIYVNDHCEAIWAAFTKGTPGEVYNFGGASERNNLEVVKAILSYFNKPDSLIKFVKDRLGHDQRYAIDATKALTTLDWKPSVTFEEGLKMTLDWYSTNQKWIDNVTSGEYKSYYKKMYESEG